MTASYDVAPARPGPDAWLHLVLAEVRMVVRDTAGLLIPIGLPALILLANGAGASGETVAGTGGLTVLEVYVVPLVLVMVMTLIGVVNMPSFLAGYRKYGVLRRLGVTPVNPLMVLAAQVVTSVLQTVVGVALALGLATIAFGMRAPQDLPAAIGAIVLVALAMYAVGMLVAAVAPSVNAAVAIGLGAFFAMGAAGGMFGSADSLPPPVARVGETLPFGAGVRMVRDAWVGEAVDPLHLTTLVAAVAIGVTGSALWFRWD